MSVYDLKAIARDREMLREKWYREGFYNKTTLSQALLKASKHKPDTKFYFHTEAGLTESTAKDIVNAGIALAASLYELGIRPGDVIAAQLPTRFEAAVIYIAVFHAGGILLPIVHSYGSAELGILLRQSHAKCLVMPDLWRGINYLERLRDAGPLPGLEHIVIVGEEVPPNGISFEGLQRLNNSNFVAPALDADAVCLLLYTSGTTAAPKGVQHTHNTTRAEWEIPFFANDGPFLNPFPAGHIAGFNYMLRPIFCGIPMVFLDRWDPRLAAEFIERYKATQSGGTPYFLMTLLQAAKENGRDLSSLTSYNLGGTNVTPAHVALTDAAGCRGGRVYGLTEHSTVTAALDSMPFAKRAYTDGRIQPGTEVHTIDENGNHCPSNVEGEIAIRGPELFVGYTDPELDLQCFLPGGWFKTGDIGVVDSDGYVTVTDRKKDIIIRGGENISSKEVENILMSHPSVEEAAAVAMPDEMYGEKVCAFVIVKRGSSLTFDEMAQYFISCGVSKQKIPEKLVLVNDMPRTPAGKIKKADLRMKLR